MSAVESDHTAPSEWCPRPERWHAPDGWATEEEVSYLVGGFVRALQPRFVVETGTYLGHTTAAIGRALKRNGHGWCHSLEIDPERAAAAERYCANLPVHVLCVDSMEYVPREPIGFAWLDSATEQRAGEVERLWDWLEDGAVVGVHDTAPHHGQDLDRLVHGMRFLNLRTPRGVLFFQVAK